MKHQRKQQPATASKPTREPKAGRTRVDGRPTTPDGASVQYAALPYRVLDGLEVLLITSRDTGRWVLPKGWPMDGRPPHMCAAREALEEAGVKGRIGKSAIGHYRYVKRLPKNEEIACSVDVYPLAVERQMKRWPEQGQRAFAWFRADSAASLVDEGELATLIEAFAATMSR